MKTHSAIAATALVFLSGIILIRPAESAEQLKNEDFVKVTILQSKPIGITPDTLTVKSGATVVWVNKDAEPVKIKFKTRIGEAAKVPMNFYGDLLGNYESSLIHHGSTASISFENPGTYEYEVRRLVKKDGKEPYEEISDGRIIVQ